MLLCATSLPEESGLHMIDKLEKAVDFFFTAAIWMLIAAALGVGILFFIKWFLILCEA